MVIPFITAGVLAVCAAFDGYYTYRAQLLGAVEKGIASAIYGQHPTKSDLIFKGGAVIAAEIIALLVASYLDHEQYASLVFSIPFIVQSIFHIFGGLSGKKISDKGVRV
jgi:uncharacterized membrane-anchored protein